MRHGIYLRILVAYLSNVAASIFENHQTVTSFQSVFPPATDKMYAHLKHLGNRRKIVCVGHSIYSVRPTISPTDFDRAERIVKLSEKTRTCGEFQELQLPCLHAASAVVESKLPIKHCSDSEKSAKHNRQLIIY